MKIQKIKILVRGSGLNYLGEVDSFTAAKVVAMCMEVSERGHEKIEMVGSKNTGLTKSSPAEYINRHAAHNNFEKILTLAAYVSEHKSKEWFTINEIRELFRIAGESLPKNITRDFKIVTKRGWIYRDTTSKDPKQKGSYYMTTTGKAALAQGFTVKK